MSCANNKSHFRKSFVPCKGYCLLLLPVVLIVNYHKDNLESHHQCVICKAALLE